MNLHLIFMELTKKLTNFFLAKQSKHKLAFAEMSGAMAFSACTSILAFDRRQARHKQECRDGPFWTPAESPHNRRLKCAD